MWSVMKILSLALLALLLAACASTVSPDKTESPVNTAASDMGVSWVKNAAEYRAITRQVYAAATLALPKFIEDSAWSALPHQSDAADLPPAVILDVDETVVTNVDFQLAMVPPFSNEKHEHWIATTRATPIEGVKDFVAAAREAGVTVFFVTNRPCVPEEEGEEGSDDPCPQRQTTIDDIAEAGIQTDADHVFLSDERGWNREKITRRKHIADNYRVIMLFGDDLGDFVSCVRSTTYSPCTNVATIQSRLTSIDLFDHYWGNGWYILPNPMYGSWTTVE